jgi:hypothetical protein
MPAEMPPDRVIVAYSATAPSLLRTEKTWRVHSAEREENRATEI